MKLKLVFVNCGRSAIGQLPSVKQGGEQNRSLRDYVWEVSCVRLLAIIIIIILEKGWQCMVGRAVTGAATFLVAPLLFKIDCAASILTTFKRCANL